MGPVDADSREAQTIVGEPGVRRVGAYVVGLQLGAGGMGVVFAGQAASGRAVAIKVMRGAGTRGAGEQRFVREAQALAGLRHPAIVEYVDHGVTPEGDVYLVMERLVGEDLGERLRRGPLAVGECIELGLRIAEGLAAAHQRGVVHRDLKPSNVYLPGGSIAGAKLLDFGVARVRGADHSLTHTGAMVGTVGFMAPEQARGEASVDGRADLYSLGCILHECLTGVPVFTGAHPMAVLAKILLEEAPAVRERRPEVPAALDDVIGWLLAKEPAGRPNDAAALVRALEQVAAELGEGPSHVRPAAGPGVTLREQRVFCLLLLRSRGATIDELANTVAGEPLLLESLARTAAAFGAVFSPMLGGYGLVSVKLAAPASDVAAQVARCALAVARQQPAVAQVMVTGRGQSDGVSFVGRVVDSALRIEGQAAAGTIVVDEASAGLLAEQFEVVRAGAQALLVREREAPTLRLLLGKPAPFVGRARELAWLEGIFREACEESRSSAALVTAGPGGGKSRLRVELLRALRASGHDPLVLLGRGTPMTRGAALGVLRPAIRREVGVVEGDSREQQRARLHRRVAETVVARDCARVEAFLGEVCGVEFADEHHPGLSLARRDASVMADATRVAWLDWLRAEARARPVLLVLEDLHWGDAASVAFAEAALRELSGLPLVVLALARPEVHTLFPGLWAGRLSLLELPPISARSSELLVRQVLGSGAAEGVVASLVARAEGNPFFLEELIRAAATGGAGPLPDTVLGVVQTRVEGQDDEARRALRAASVFGEEFSEAALAVVLGGPGVPLRLRLAGLVQQEFLTRELRPEGVVFRFRHALVREACDAMLTEDDRALGHRLAGEWLAGQEGQEPIAIAKHFVQAGLPGAALGWFRRAAERALAGSDLGAAVERAEQAIECGAAGEELAELRLIQAEARTWAGSLADAERWASAAMQGLPGGSRRWFVAVQRAIYGASVRGDAARVRELLAQVDAVTPAPEARFGPLLCRCEALYTAFVVSDMVWLAALVGEIEAQVGDRLPPEVMAQVQRARASAAASGGRFDVAARAGARAAEEFEAAGDQRGAVRMRVLQGHSLMLVGALGPAEEVLRGAKEVATRLGATQTLNYGMVALAEVCMYSGRLAEARELLEAVVEHCRERDDPRVRGGTHIELARLALRDGRAAEAEAWVRRGLELVAGQPALEVWGYAVLGRMHLACGELAAAAGWAERAAEMMQALSSSFFYDAYVSLAIVECLAGRAAQADALAAGLGRLRRSLGRLVDPELRASLLAMEEWRVLVGLAQRAGLAVDDLVGAPGSLLLHAGV